MCFKLTILTKVIIMFAEFIFADFIFTNFSSISDKLRLVNKKNLLPKNCSQFTIHNMEMGASSYLIQCIHKILDMSVEKV